MSEEVLTSVFQFDLGEHGGRLRFQSPQELQSWSNKEAEAWRWIASGAQNLHELFKLHGNFQNEVHQHASEWQNALASQHSDRIPRIFTFLENTLKQRYKKEQILNSASAKGTFVFHLKEKRGEDVAAGAYAVLVGSELDMRRPSTTAFLEGIIEGFLYQREIEWTATAHQEVLNRLKNQYAGNLSHQDRRFDEIEEQNRQLNERFGGVLREREELLQKLHEEQAAEFKRIAEQHIENLKTIEDTYNQKLALQKPVDYWKAKETYHGSLSKRFGWVTLGVFLIALAAMAYLVGWVFGGLLPGEEPRPWQLGILVVGAFFAIWTVRVLLRLFFSHLHLATDAAERRTMILTFLSMSREGAEFAQEDSRDARLSIY